MNNRHPASFRDPSGFIYEQNGIIYRFVDVSYQPHFAHLLSSDLLHELLKEKLILPFEQLNDNHFQAEQWFTTLMPQRIPFENYAWEWSFEQLKDAALVTLDICKRALQKEMLLKDATHFNIQFTDGLPKHIDTLSFELYEEGNSWVAYRQFCECFLNPLLLAVYCSMEPHKLMLAYPQGVPVELTSNWLPFHTKLNTHILLHVHIHSRYSKPKKQKNNSSHKKVSKADVLNILNSLTICISNLKLKEQTTAWNNYYNETVLSQEYLSAKTKLVNEWLQPLHYNTACDFGTNDGAFAKLCRAASLVVAADFDASCIQHLYQSCKKEKNNTIVPLIIDLTQPTPSMGWNNNEQQSFLQRCKFDISLALALVHHLRIGKNISWQQIALLFAEKCRMLIIEFVPKTDEKVQVMLNGRKDIFIDYTQEAFENMFGSYFNILKNQTVGNTERIIYLMQRK